MVIAATTVLVALLIYYNTSSISEPKAAIVDQLSSHNLGASRYPNKTFIETAKEMLHKRFSKIDYYSDNATVEQYRQLATQDYRLILWRAHSALDLEDKYVAISTTEKYRPADHERYLDSGHLTLCNITGEGTLYVGITPKFIKEQMTGRFEKTWLILMSCNGLKLGYTETATTLVEKGAEVFISWTSWIAASENDNLTTKLLDCLINENRTVQEAVDQVPESTLYGSPCKLIYYPAEAANNFVPSYVRSEVPNCASFLKTLYSKRSEHSC